MADPINSPSHYVTGGIETIDYLQAKLEPLAFIGFLQGNVLKYMSRAAHKNDAFEDFRKAQWYLNKLVAYLDTTQPPAHDEIAPDAH